MSLLLLFHSVPAAPADENHFTRILLSPITRVERNRYEKIGVKLQILSPPIISPTFRRAILQPLVRQTNSRRTARAQYKARNLVPGIPIVGARPNVYRLQISIGMGL